MNDVINHPSHYVDGRKYEPIDVIHDWDLDFCLGNVLKYISRAGRKPGNEPIQDLMKARFYLDYEIKRFTSTIHVDEEIKYENSNQT